MRHLIIFLIFIVSCLIADNAMGQTIGSTKTEQYKADFEKKRDISAYMDYDGPQIPIQILIFTIEHFPKTILDKFLKKSK